MKKTLIAILCALMLSITAIFASACSFFGGSSEIRQIDRIYSVYSEEDGGTYIIIEYVGDEYEDDTFFIADAEPGKEGTGIRSITPKLNDDGTTTITIEYTDASKYPAEFTIPNGLYISNIISDTDPETGARTLTIVFSDPAVEPLVITIDSGKDGIDGDKIQDIYTEIDEETGDTVVHVVMHKYNAETGEWEDDEITFTIPKAEKGNGIKEISVNYQSYSDPNNMYLDVVYEDGSRQTLAIPRANSWYTGVGAPGPAQYNVGDFYFDTAGYAIWNKTTNGWVKLVDFSAFSQDMHAVYFYVEGVCVRTEYIMHGYNFVSSNLELYVPTREDGYVFAGWYTKDVNSDGTVNPNSGHFTDLTYVLSDINLYAHWAAV